MKRKIRCICEPLRYETISTEDLLFYRRYFYGEPKWYKILNNIEKPITKKESEELEESYKDLKNDQS